jgi:polyhydroxyalkanoate synthase
MDGILQAITVTKNICKVEQIHCVGYCVGGTALGTLLAWLNSEQHEIKKNPVAHATFFCSLFTFEQPGEIDVFIDEKIVEMLEESMAKLGYLDGKQMGNTFRLLRSNSLIWSYFANSYLLGQQPMAFDVLFWNTDNTRLPEKLHSFYLRNYYLENKLAKKNSLEIKGQKLDLGRIKQPVYAVGTEQDHITPWKETFKSISMTGGEKRYALSTSGHIVGILNPPVNPPKREYWVNDLNTQENVDQWLDKQKVQHGTWWDDWSLWLEAKCGTLISPPSIGNNEYKIICDAPGTYVLE